MLNFEELKSEKRVNSFFIVVVLFAQDFFPHFIHYLYCDVIAEYGVGYFSNRFAYMYVHVDDDGDEKFYINFITFFLRVGRLELPFCSFERNDIVIIEELFFCV